MSLIIFAVGHLHKLYISLPHISLIFSSLVLKLALSFVTAF